MDISIKQDNSFEDQFYEVYNIIQENYLIGIKDDSKLYRNSSKFKLLQEKLSLKLESSEYKKFKQMISGEIPLGLTSKDETSLLSPGFSGYFLIDEFQNDKCWGRQSIHIEMSFLGKFFTIYRKKMGGVSFFDGYFTRFAPIIYASPSKEFDDYFLKITKEVYSRFPDYQYLPLGLLEKKIQGLFLPIISRNHQFNIYQAIFNGNDLFEFKIHGDKKFAIKK